MSHNEHAFPKTREGLVREVKRRIKYAKKRDWRNYYYAQTLLVLAVIASSLVALSSALELDKNITTGLALIPAFVYAIESRLKFEAKSFFYYDYTLGLEAVLLDIEYLRKPMDELISQLQQVEKRVEFPRLGRETKDTE